MLLVYLDQNKWIDLARAEQGHELGKPFEDVLIISREAAARRFAGFPLSAIHYMEVWNARSARRRQDLAGVMLGLAQPTDQVGPLTIAGVSELLPCELDRALHRRFGKPRQPRHYPVLGFGVRHAFGMKQLLSDDFSATLRLLPWQQQWAILRLFETLALQGPLRDLPVAGIDTERYRQPSLTYQKSQEDLAERFRKFRVPKSRRDQTLAAVSIIDILDPLNEALARAGISIDESPELDDPDGLLALLIDLPTRHVAYELHRLLHDDPGQRRKRGDLDDLAALSVATVYCDVVVTERMWADLIRRGKLDQTYGTRVLRKLEDLVPILASAGAVG